eukprot:CAMPEP_0119365374 /NCGR_PEP_ID=MMETSP1334-20130426/12317_1 /TAXON_ID=127549 /ORGANISM="Calcidiscus leptoporus, Strain RCC1130" /LENGTH=52 /DNA_ID=CAMNT_0007381343 /DNA_START=634 /DNA_END=792 /DNA_ORIENTATION=-
MDTDDPERELQRDALSSSQGGKMQRDESAAGDSEELHAWHASNSTQAAMEGL